MKRSHIAALIAASALGCTLPAWAVAPSQDAQDPAAQKHADQASQESTATPSDSSPDQSDQSQSDQARASKHPPTAVMDRATPPEKSTDEGGDAGNEEKNLRDRSEVGGDPGEAKEPGNERNEKKDDGPFDHEYLL